MTSDDSPFPVDTYRSHFCRAQSKFNDCLNSNISVTYRKKKKQKNAYSRLFIIGSLTALIQMRASGGLHYDQG